MMVVSTASTNELFQREAEVSKIEAEKDLERNSGWLGHVPILGALPRSATGEAESYFVVTSRHPVSLARMSRIRFAN